ncbi:MAG: hypothetical protein ABI852_11610 [Gemmatimonadaceae bacterium]
MLSNSSCANKDNANAGAARYLYVWAGDVDGKDSDFLAVIDVKPGSKTFGQVLNTLPVGMKNSLPHHLEYTLPPLDQTLFGNGHHLEAILRFDIADAEHPKIAGTVALPPTLRFPHDFARLTNNNVLVGFLRSDGQSPVPGDSIKPGAAGGIAEYTHDGKLLRFASAADSTLEKPFRPYGFALLPAADRFVITSASMMEDQWANAVQIWSLSKLARLQTLPLPPAKLSDGRVLALGNSMPFEPRAMSDGSVFLSAYGCGFYRITGIADKPEIHNVYTIDVPTAAVPADNEAACGIPVIVDHFWIMPVGKLGMLITLDIADPEHPREVSRLQTDADFHPHWMAKDPGSNRLIVGAENGGENRMLMATVDAATGKVTWDETVRTPDGKLGISFVHNSWPHGNTGEAFGHAALFRQ